MRTACATIGRRAHGWPRKEFGERAGSTAEVSRQAGRMLHSWGGAALDPVPQRKVLAVNVFNELLRRHIALEQSHDVQGLRRAANARDASCAQVVTFEDHVARWLATPCADKMTLRKHG